MIPTDWQIYIKDSQGEDNVTAFVTSISEISTELDLETPSGFNAASMQLVIHTDSDGNFPAKMLYPNTVRVTANSNDIFNGEILTIDTDVKGHTSTVVISDATQRMRNEALDDFGIAKRVRVTGVEDTDSGEYPFRDILSPVSNQSLKNPRSGRTGLRVVDSFVTEGLLDRTNISYDENTLRSEGQALDVDPDVTLKAPYRNKTISFLVKSILEHYGITSTNQDVSVDDISLNSYHFTTNGRVGYDTQGNLDTANPLTTEQDTADFWNGNVTDFMVSGSKFYFLYSGRYNSIIDQYKYFLRRRGIVSGTVSSGEVLISSGSLKMYATSTQAAFFTALGAGDKIVLDPAEKSNVPTALRSPIVWTLTSAPTYNSTTSTVELTSTQYETNGARFSSIDYNVYAVEAPDIAPKIIEYDPATDEYSVVFTRTSHAEWWKFVKSGDVFYILGTTKSSPEIDYPILGAYDPTETSPKTFIEKLDISSTPTLTTYIASTHSRKPVVGMYYQMGFDTDGNNNNVRKGIQPDTRKGFYLNGTKLYYIYASANNCGIAEATAANTTTSFVTINYDGRFNHLGLDFCIDSNTLYGVACFQKATESTRIVYSKSIT